MRSTTWICRAGCFGAFAILVSALFISPAGAQPGQGELEARGAPGTDLIDDTIDLRTPGQAYKYSLGAKLTSVPKALDEQLQLAGEGALVAAFVKDGPAEKAGLKMHDIILAVGDEPVKSLAAVVDAVQKSEGKELAFKVLRAGKRITLNVKPAELKEGDRLRSQSPDWSFDVDVIEEKIREKLKDAGVEVRLQLIQPGHFIPHGISGSMQKPKDFPEDLTIVVRKQGSKPAEIEATRGDKNWKVNEHELDKLPEEIRPHVLAQLGRGPMQFSIALPGGNTLNLPVPPPVGEVRRDVVIQRPDIQTRERIRGGLERRIDELSRDMERMQDRMEHLRRELRGQSKGGDEVEKVLEETSDKEK